MTVTYTNTRRDLLAFQLHYARRSPVSWAVPAASLAIIGLLFFRSAQAAALAPRIVASGLFLLLLLPLVGALQVAILALGAMLRHGHEPIPEQLTLSNAGMRIETATGCQDYQWRGIKKLCRTRRHLFIYLTPSLACLVPRRAVPNAACHPWRRRMCGCPRG